MVFVLVAAALGAGSGAQAEPGNACGPGLYKVADDPEGAPVCTHGADPAADASGVPLFPADSGAAPATPCFDGGSTGYRIEVLYGHPADTPNNYAASVPTIRNAVAFADKYFEESDSATAQHLRWLCDATNQIVVHNVTLQPIGTDGEFTFWDMYRSLQGGPGKKSAGFKSRDRIYVTFVDGIKGVYNACGQAIMDRDDSPGLNNKNNVGPAYALIGTGCWNGAVTLHEIGHTIGAVQPSAPHNSGGGKAHCYDEMDVMCYDDGGSYFLGPDGQDGTADDGSLQMVCVDPLKLPVDGEDQQFDCNQDDYYDPSPAPGSYLATHWNTANSNWIFRQ